MNTNSLRQCIGIGDLIRNVPVTREMLRTRAIELAMLDGRSPSEIWRSDWEHAKRDLMGNPKMDYKELLLESAPESDRWNLVPGSTGHKVSVISDVEEDDEGRSDNEKLVEEGIEGAEVDLMRQANLYNTEYEYR